MTTMTDLLLPRGSTKYKEQVQKLLESQPGVKKDRAGELALGNSFLGLPGRGVVSRLGVQGRLKNRVGGPGPGWNDPGGGAAQAREARPTWKPQKRNFTSTPKQTQIWRWFPLSTGFVRNMVPLDPNPMLIIISPFKRPWLRGVHHFQTHTHAWFIDSIPIVMVLNPTRSTIVITPKKGHLLAAPVEDWPSPVMSLFHSARGVVLMVRKLFRNQRDLIFWTAPIYLI